MNMSSFEESQETQYFVGFILKMLRKTQEASDPDSICLGFQSCLPNPKILTLAYRLDFVTGKTSLVGLNEFFCQLLIGVKPRSGQNRSETGKAKFVIKTVAQLFKSYTSLQPKGR